MKAAVKAIGLSIGIILAANLVAAAVTALAPATTKVQASRAAIGSGHYELRPLVGLSWDSRAGVETRAYLGRQVSQ
jgi:hypothetical protein